MSHVLLLHPNITPDLINSVIVPAAAGAGMNQPALGCTVVYKDDASLAKRRPVVASVLPEAVHLVMEAAAANNDEGGIDKLLLRCFYDDKWAAVRVKPAARSDSGFDCGTDCCDDDDDDATEMVGADDWETIDDVGRSIFYSSLGENL